MKKLILLSAFCLFAFVSVFSQNTYYIKNGAKILSPKYNLILKEDRTEFDPYYMIKIRIRDSVHTFTPKIVSEYKRDDGKTFVREKLPDGSDVFMELVEDGYLKLYYVIDNKYQKRFFIKKETILTEISDEAKGRSNFRRVLKKNWDQCKKTKKLVDIAEYNRTSLKRTVKAHNTCKELYFPKFKKSIAFGVIMIQPVFNYGTEVNSLANEGVYRNFLYKYNINYTGAIGLSFPIKQSNLSLETGLRVHAMKYRYATIFSLNSPFDREFEVKMSLVDLTIPFDLQYTVPKLKYRPFVKIGFAPNFFLSNKVEVLERLVFAAEENIEKETLKTMGISFNLCVGFQQQLINGNELQFTLGFHRRGATSPGRIFNFTGFYYLIGYGF